MANRYWVGSGSSANWNATGNTNWSDTSGGTNNFSVPTSTDDVIFDGAGTNGNTNATISATITVKSLTITTGYTSTMTHNAVLTIAGNWTYTGNYTIAGSSGITISATSTITSNGVTWPNALTFTTDSTTRTLSGNLTVSGLVTFNGRVTINKTASETFTISGGITVNLWVQGTAKIILTGGTWSSTSPYEINNSLDIQGDVTISGTVTYGTGTLTYVSGTVTTTGSTFQVTSTCTLNTSGISWNNFTFRASNTTTLTSNLTANGLVTVSAATTLNRTTAETLICAGGITMNATMLGTAKVIITGGTWSGGVAGFSKDVDINGNVTISGTVWFNTGVLTYVSGTVTTTGSTLTLNGNPITLNTNGINWNNVTVNSGGTVTLTSNFTANGLWNNAASLVINKTTAETVTIGGGMTISQTFNGTAKVILTGGTWSSGVASFWNPLDIQGNVTVSGVVYINSNTVTYVSGTVTTTGSTLNCYSGSITLNTNGITWNNVVSDSAAKTITLTSNLSIGGSLTISGATTLNGSSYTATVAGGLNAGLDIGGTAKIILTGGTWSGAGGIVTCNFDLNGNITLSGLVNFSTRTLTYVSGNIITTGSTLQLWSSCTLNTKGILWNNLSFRNNTQTCTLTSDLNITGLLFNNTNTFINKTGSEIITVYGGMNITSGDVTFNTKIILNGGVWSGNASLVGDMDLNGDIIISGNVLYKTGQLTYLKGKINSSNGTLNITASATLLNFHKCPLKAVVITAGQTVTMNRFFCGTPSQICQVSSTGANYTITFQDQFEKIGRHVAVSGCTLSRPMQLLLINNQRFNTNRSTNVGIRYTNQSPNGIPINMAPTSDMTAPAMGLVADPCFVKQG